MNANQFTKPTKLDFEGNVAENFRRFCQQFEIYMSATGFNATTVPKKKQAAILLNIAGEEAIEVFNTFAFAEEADKDDPEVILAKFQNYCEPKKNITYERHIFNTRMQQPAQSFDAYLTELRVQAKKCAYGILQDELIRDRLVVGIRDDKVRSRLLREPELNLQKCIDIAHAAEIAQKQMNEIKDETQTVHDVKPTPWTKPDATRFGYETKRKSQDRRQLEHPTVNFVVHHMPSAKKHAPHMEKYVYLVEREIILQKFVNRQEE